MGQFTPLFNSVKTRPRSEYNLTTRRRDYFINLLKDELSFTSLLALGATLNILLFLAIGNTALILAPLLLVVKIFDVLLQLYGLRKVPGLEKVVRTKYSAQLPDAQGIFGSTPASEQVTVFIIGARNDHPLGILAPGWINIGKYFGRMNRELERKSEEYGFLGASSWVANGQRATNNTSMTILYFRSAEGVHSYAHGDLHREAWNWWNSTFAGHGHISIWHELFVAPKEHWETIYINCEPLLLGATTFPKKGTDGVEWVSPIVDARRGPLKSSRGRMTLTDGKDIDKYGAEPYGA